MGYVKRNPLDCTFGCLPSFHMYAIYSESLQKKSAVAPQALSRTNKHDQRVGRRHPETSAVLHDMSTRPDRLPTPCQCHARMPTLCQEFTRPEAVLLHFALLHFAPLLESAAEAARQILVRLCAPCAGWDARIQTALFKVTEFRMV